MYLRYHKILFLEVIWIIKIQIFNLLYDVASGFSGLTPMVIFQNDLVGIREAGKDSFSKHLNGIFLIRVTKFDITWHGLNFFLNIKSQKF